jgi:hypothetical protein
MSGLRSSGTMTFCSPKSPSAQHSPHEWNAPIVYGARQQFATCNNTPTLDIYDVKRVQEVLGTLLCYAHAVDCTMLAAIGSITTQQVTATKMTLRAITQLLDYATLHPDAIVQFKASAMVLYVGSDASYLSETKARSRVAGCHYLSDAPTNPLTPPLPNAPFLPLNAAINAPCKILRAVLSSAAEAGLGALFYNGKEPVPERITLDELGHPQPPTPMVTDNSAATGIANDSVKQK